MSLTPSRHAKSRSKLSIWWRAFRFHFVPPSFLPAILGGIVAWAEADGRFQPLCFALTVVGVTINHIGLNMVDDYFDFKSGVDKAEEGAYSGGSGVLSGGLIAPRSLFVAAMLCFLTTILIGIYLTVERGLLVLLFGLIGLFSSYFYTAPPIKLAYRGFGELGLLVNFGPVIGLGSYYVQAQRLTWEPFLVTLPLGILMWSMIIINEIPDYEEDRANRKMNLVVKFGREAGVELYVIGITSAYTVILVAAALRITSAFTLVGLLTVPIALRSIKTLKENYLDKVRMAPANSDIIKVHTATGALLIAGCMLSKFILV